MRFLIDQNRSPALAALLREQGHDAVPTMDRGLARVEDAELLSLAASKKRIIVSGDTDFGTLLAGSRSVSPSVILFRSRRVVSAAQHAALLSRHLGELEEDLTAGCIVVVSDDRIRVRRLPLISSSD